MPTANEVVTNKALSGTEVKEIILLDVNRLLDAEGLLSHYVAYGRISYDVTVRLHLDNPMMRESSVTVASKPQAGTVIEAPPLTAPSKESVASGTNVHRDITSPNAERLRHGIPVPVVTRQQDGTQQTELVKYPPQPDLGPGEVIVTDETVKVREQWKTTDTSSS
jgi:hypothetical protein